MKKLLTLILLVSVSLSNNSYIDIDYRDFAIKFGINSSRIYSYSLQHKVDYENIIVEPQNNFQLGILSNSDGYIWELNYIMNKFLIKFYNTETQSEFHKGYNLGFVNIDLLDKVGGNLKKDSQLLFGIRFSILFSQEI